MVTDRAAFEISCRTPVFVLWTEVKRADFRDQATRHSSLQSVAQQELES
jgi:hypothetical protein